MGALLTDAKSLAPDRDLERSLRLLHARRGQELFGLALRLGVSRDDAEDAVQETMLRLWRELDRGKQIQDIDSWAFRTLSHLAVDARRNRLRLRGLVARIIGQPPQQRSQDPAATTASMAVWEAVDRLPPRQRAVVYLHYRADLQFDSIGSVLGITAGAARTHASLAIAKLRQTVGKEL